MVVGETGLGLVGRSLRPQVIRGRWTEIGGIPGESPTLVVKMYSSSRSESSS